MRLALIVGLLVSFVDSGLKAQLYNVTEIGSFAIDRGVSAAGDINDLAQVVGYRDQIESPHAFLWSNGVITEFGNEGGEYTRVYGSRINNVGQVVGSRYTAGGAVSAYLWQDGVTVALGALPGGDTATGASGINDAGIVTGVSGRRPFIWESGLMRDFSTLPGASEFYYVAGINNRGTVAGTILNDGTNPFWHATTWRNGETVDLGDIPGETHYYSFIDGNYSVASAINDIGQVAGRSDGADGFHAFFWSDGMMTDLGALPGLDNRSSASDINNAGVVVGYSGDEISHAFVWDSINGMQNLNDLLDETGQGWLLTRANGINNHGQIVGAGFYNGQARGYLLTPIPEPSSLLAAATALGSAVLAATTRRLFRRRTQGSP